MSLSVVWRKYREVYLCLGSLGSNHIVETLKGVFADVVCSVVNDAGTPSAIPLDWKGFKVRVEGLGLEIDILCI